MSHTVGKIARHIQGEPLGDESLVIQEVSTIEAAREGSLVFAENEAYFQRAEASQASCIIAPRAQRSSQKTLILVDSPRLAFAKAITLYHPPKVPRPGVHPSSVLGEHVYLGSAVSIGPFVAIGDRVQIGDRAVIGPCCVIGDDCVIGADSVLRANVTLYDQVRIGCRVLIHAGSVIGSDGFGFTREDGRHVKISQVGNVIIEDDVEVGANVTIDRATLGSTIVRRGVKTDNLVHIGHNVTVGEDSLLIAQTGIGGSSTLGRGCILGGAGRARELRDSTGRRHGGASVGDPFPERDQVGRDRLWDSCAPHSEDEAAACGTGATARASERGIQAAEGCR